MSGGGLSADGGTTAVTDVRFEGHVDGYHGSAMYVGGAATVQATRVHFVDNYGKNGVISVRGTLNVVDSVFENNVGDLVRRRDLSVVRRSHRGRRGDHNEND